VASKGINLKVKREAIIKALQQRLTEMVHVQEAYQYEVEQYEKAHDKWKEDVAKVTLKLLDIKTVADNISVRNGYHSNNTQTNVMIDVMIEDNKLPVEPESPKAPFNDRWQGKNYLGNYDERVAEIKNAISILNLSEEETVNASTYANVAKYL